MSNSSKGKEQTPKMTSLFRIQTLLLLQSDRAKSGYDLAKELGNITGKKPSSGKLYPFLHELRDSGFTEEIESSVSGRNRSEYILTDKGDELKIELMQRMENLLSIRLEQMLDKCYHCGVSLYESKVEGKDKEGSTIVFCCSHCKAAWDEAN